MGAVLEEHFEDAEIKIPLKILSSTIKKRGVSLD